MNSEYDQINFVENIGFSTKSFYEKFSECEAVYQPKNVQQSIVFWLMKKLKMTYVQEIYKTNIKTYRWTLPEDLRYKLENAILNFFRREPTIKKQDLIVLCGSEQFNQIVSFDLNSEFHLSEEITYSGIKIKMIPYMKGILVINKKDLER